MRIFYRRPMALACFGYLVCAAVAMSLPRSWVWLVTVSVGVLLLGVLVGCFLRESRRGRRKVSVVSITCLLLLFMCFAALLRFAVGTHQRQSAYDGHWGQTCQVSGTIVEEESAVSGFCRYELAAETADGQRIGGRLILTCEFSAAFHTGDRVCLTGELMPLEADMTRQMCRYYLSHGCFGVLVCSDPETVTVLPDASAIKRVTGQMRCLFAGWRTRCALAFRDMLGKDNGTLVSALFLGDRDALDDQIVKQFRRSGVSHLLALSGIHVSILLMLLTVWLNGFGVPKPIGQAVMTVAALGYLCLVGFRLTAVRAVVMVLAQYLAGWLGEQNDPLTTLGVTGAGIVFCSPTAVWDAGFLMSFSAVFGLVVIMPYFQKWLRSRHVARVRFWCLTACMASFVATVAVSFVTWLFVGEVSLFGIPMTVLLTPVLTGILVGAPILLLLYGLPHLAPGVLGKGVAALAELMQKMTEAVSESEWAVVSLKYPFAGATLLLMTAALLILFAVPLRKKRVLLAPPLGAALLICLGIVLTSGMSGQTVEAVYSVTASGEQLLVTDAGTHRAVIVDTSSGAYSVFRQTALALDDKPVTEIDGVILTHYHRAFVYSLERLARQYTLRAVYLPIPENEDEWRIMKAVRDRLTPLHTQVYDYKVDSDLYLFEDCTFTVVSNSSVRRSTKPLTVYRFDTPRESLCRVPIALAEAEAESEDRDRVAEVMSRCQVLVIGGYGPLPRVGLPLSPLQEGWRLCLLDNAGLLPFLCPAEEGVYRVLGDGRFFTDISTFHFEMLR